MPAAMAQVPPGLRRKSLRRRMGSVLLRSVLLALTLSLAACGSSAYTAIVTPSPVVPGQAVLSVAGAFMPFKNQYGDSFEALNLKITSNVPVAFKVQVHFTHFQSVPGGPAAVSLHYGKADEKCTGEYGCLVNLVLQL